MLGTWQNYALVCIALIFTSLGLGFVISLLAETESQAVQLAMIALLLSVFFSGFILDLRYFWEPVRVISYAITGDLCNHPASEYHAAGERYYPAIYGGISCNGRHILHLILADAAAAYGKAVRIGESDPG